MTYSYNSRLTVTRIYNSYIHTKGSIEDQAATVSVSIGLIREIDNINLISCHF